MSVPSPARQAFVPHDLRAPIKGSAVGPLAGLTVAVKDMYDIEGERTGGGSPHWLAVQRPATETAASVQKLLDAGATIIGKTVCDEFFYSVTGANAHYGTPINPRALGRIPGGSSSGSASATASGACDIGLGSDTGGSVRVPAAFCGLYGIRPTHGRVDLAGAMPMAGSFDVAGWFASGPGLFRRVGGVLLTGERAHAPIGRLLVLDDAFEQTDAEVATLLRRALAVMTEDLPKLVRPGLDDKLLVERVRIAPQGFDPWRECFRIIQAREVWQNYASFMTQHQPRLGPGVRERVAFAATTADSDAQAARAVQAQARAHIRALAQPGTVLALPTAPCIAPRLDLPAAEIEPFRVRVMRLTCIAGVAGLPQVTIPVGTVAGCPVGLSFIGWPGADEALLDLAVATSRAVGLDDAPAD
jgi:amidase